jgi:hypothetical protein
VYNLGAATNDSFASVDGLGWSVVSPVVNEGRIGLGLWQMDRHVLALDEALDLSLARAPGGPALSGSYDQGRTLVSEDEALYAAGGVWIQPLGDGDQQLAAGVLYLDQTGRGRLRVSGENTLTGVQEPLRDMAARRTMNGFGLTVGYFYRPLPDGSLGISVTYLGSMTGHIWEQDEGGPLFTDRLTRPAQTRIGIGGSFKVATGLVVAVDMRYAGEVRGSATLFGGTAASRAVNEVADATFAIHAGVEYRLPLFLGDMPLRVGYFNRPDPLPASTAGAGAGAVSAFLLPSIKQDVTGFTIGTGFTRSSVSFDVALEYLLVTTHTKLLLPGALATVDSGDVRSTLGGVASVTLRFGPKAGD